MSFVRLNSKCSLYSLNTFNNFTHQFQIRFKSTSHSHKSSNDQLFSLSGDSTQKSSSLVKMWTKGVPVEEDVKKQIFNLASLPIISGHIAVMPDVHLGKGSAVGTVIPSERAIIPSAVGVDIGCGMVAVRTSLSAEDLPENLYSLRTQIELSIPHGRTIGKVDKGSWRDPNERPDIVGFWRKNLQRDFDKICYSHPKIKQGNTVNHLGTLGTGNHFIELCLDESSHLWAMLHSGSRGVGNLIGRYFIELAKKDMGVHLSSLPDQDLAYLREGTKYFDDYMEAVSWAQNFAYMNRQIMMNTLLNTLRNSKQLPPFTTDEIAVNCHHNYVSRGRYFGKDLYITRKGAVSAEKGQLGIIPGSMGARSFIVKGLGNSDSYDSCSHGAGRIMSRTKAKKVFSLEDHRVATEGVECRKDVGVIDETPNAYKSIDDVMKAQSDLVEVVHQLKQILCVKG